MIVKRRMVIESTCRNRLDQTLKLVLALSNAAIQVKINEGMSDLWQINSEEARLNLGIGVCGASNPVANVHECLLRYEQQLRTWV